jgi:hypothetical protein
MDPRLYRLQGRAGLRHVTGSELLRVLTEFSGDRLTLLQRHEAGARVAAHYDFNNTYQYVIAREDTHLSWLADALEQMGAAMPGAGEAMTVPAVAPYRTTAGADSCRALLEDDEQRLGAFVEKWQPEVAAVSHARHRRMLEVILGESLEHRRLFGQAANGFEDVLGHRTSAGKRVGGVLATRGIG